MQRRTLAALGSRSDGGLVPDVRHHWRAQHVFSHVAGHSGAGLLAPGSAVAVTWPPDACVLLAE